MSSDDFLAAAVAIGHGLVADAIWHEDRCSWMGAAGLPAVRSRPEYRPVGPLLYDGTAGTGLFLAELAGVTGDASLDRTAIGALRHAVARAPAHAAGHHGGTLGIAWAAARLGLTAEARELAERHVAPPAGPDLVDGSAGSLVALVGLAASLGESGLLAEACELGDALLASAKVTRHGWSWAHPVRRYPHHLCGVAHGAGGIAAALLELSVASGEERFLAAAAGGFAYERSWLHAGSWPDLRLPARRGVPATVATRATWCYGEAGIALSRLRATQLLGDGPHRHDADISLATTHRRLAAALPFAIDDLSLCHGLGGAAEALLTAGDHDTAAEFGRVALARYGQRGDWPCGVYGTTPGLFRGLSGIGWGFLRLHDTGIPSPLALPSALDKRPAASILRSR